MRITDILNKPHATTAKRLADKSAWVAHIHVNGSVKLSHARHNDIHLDDRQQLESWIVNNGLEKWQVLIVEIVNSQTAGLCE